MHRRLKLRKVYTVLSKSRCQMWSRSDSGFWALFFWVFIFSGLVFQRQKASSSLNSQLEQKQVIQSKRNHSSRMASKIHFSKNGMSPEMLVRAADAMCFHPPVLLEILGGSFPWSTGAKLKHLLPRYSGSPVRRLTHGQHLLTCASTPAQGEAADCSSVSWKVPSTPVLSREDGLQPLFVLSPCTSPYSPKLLWRGEGCLLRLPHYPGHKYPPTSPELLKVPGS